MPTLADFKSALNVHVEKFGRASANRHLKAIAGTMDYRDVAEEHYAALIAAFKDRAPVPVHVTVEDDDVDEPEAETDDKPLASGKTGSRTTLEETHAALADMHDRAFNTFNHPPRRRE